MKRAVVCLVFLLFMMTQLSLADANVKQYQPAVKSADTHTAYIDSITLKNGSVYLNADYIQWYEGEEANQKFREIEQDPEMTEAPDGYYIINDNPKIRKLEVAANAVVLMQIYNRTGNINEADIVWNEPITLDKFVKLINDDSEWDMKDFPYHLTIKNGKITKIVQQYIP